jgi:hypothetical protein
MLPGAGTTDAACTRNNKLTSPDSEFMSDTKACQLDMFIVLLKSMQEAVGTGACNVSHAGNRESLLGLAAVYKLHGDDVNSNELLSKFNLISTVRTVATTSTKYVE